MTNRPGCAPGRSSAALRICFRPLASYFALIGIFFSGRTAAPAFLGRVTASTPLLKEASI
jgi:hypothetical protein